VKILYIAWSDKKVNKWLPVGRLCYDSEKYIFCYTKGAKESPRFIPFGTMVDLERVYTSEDLFPLFENRLLNRNRPEFKRMLSWLDIEEEDYDPLDVLALTEGKRGTDSLEIFPCPTISSDNIYRMSFFSHGLRYIDERATASLEDLKEGDLLYLLPDPQNRYDPNAIIMRSDDPVRFAGYCPRYIVKDFHSLLKDVDPAMIHVTIKRLNFDAPAPYRILCNIRAKCPDGFRPCSDPLFEPILSIANDFCSLKKRRYCTVRNRRE